MPHFTGRFLNPIEWNPLLWACLVAVPFYLFTVLWAGSPAAGIAVGVGVGLFVALRRNSLIMSLRRRAEVTPSLIDWNVEIDHVHVGSLSDAELAAMRLAVLSDLSTYAKQFLNMGRIALQACWSSFCVLCLMVFLLSMSILAVAPRELTYLLQTALVTHPQHLTYLALLFVTSVCSITSLSLWVGWFGGQCYFGLTNYFSQSLTNLIRSRYHSSSSGSLVLVRTSGSTLQFNTELSRL